MREEQSTILEYEIHMHKYDKTILSCIADEIPDIQKPISKKAGVHFKLIFRYEPDEKCLWIDLEWYCSATDTSGSFYIGNIESNSAKMLLETLKVAVSDMSCVSEDQDGVKRG